MLYSREYLLSIIFICFSLLSGLVSGNSLPSSFFPEKSKSNFSVMTNPIYSANMLNENTILINRKQSYLLHARKNGLIKNNKLYIGMRAIALIDYQTANSAGRFGWLMRHPTAGNQIGTTVSEAVVHSLQVGFTGTVLPWATMYANILYNPEQSFGPGTITSLDRNLIQIRKAYITLGDLNKSPFYFTIGKLEGPFGLGDSVNPFTMSITGHVFNSLSYGAKFSAEANGWSTNFMLMQGGAQFRAANTSVGGTNVPSKLNNFALDINYTFGLANKAKMLVGASYQKGTVFCQEFPIEHMKECKKNNPAYGVYTELSGKQWTVLAEFAQTLRVWPGTTGGDGMQSYVYTLPLIHPTGPPCQFKHPIDCESHYGPIAPASKVTSFSLGASYALPFHARSYTFSGEFGRFIAGAKGTPWEKTDQIVLGLSSQFGERLKFFGEYIRANGWTPLNFLSGFGNTIGNVMRQEAQGPCGTPNMNWSCQDSHTNIFMLGLEAVF